MDEIIEISDEEIITIDSDDSIELVENKSTPIRDSPIGESSGFRQSSTDREVESNDDIDLDRVHFVSSDDDDEDDQAIRLRRPNPMIPGNLVYLYFLYGSIWRIYK